VTFFFSRFKLLLPALFLTVVLFITEHKLTASAQDADRCTVALPQELHDAVSAVQSIGSSADQKVLTDEMGQLEQLENDTSACLIYFAVESPNSYGSALVAIYGSRKWRILYLERLGRYQEALDLAEKTEIDIHASVQTQLTSISSSNIATLGSIADWIVADEGSLRGKISSGALPDGSDVLEGCRRTVNVGQLDGLSAAARIGACIAKHGHREQAIQYLRGSLHNWGNDISDEGRALAYDQLATLEEQNGDSVDAIAHLKDAYSASRSASDATQTLVATDFRRIAPTTYRQTVARADAELKAEENAAYSQAMANMSADEKAIYAEEGPADHIEHFDSNGVQEETWWYYAADGSGYRVGYTFVNGRLTSTYRP